MRSRISRQSTLVAITLLVFGGWPTSEVGGQTTTRPIFSGQATAVDATVYGLDGKPIFQQKLGDTGYFEGPAFENDDTVLDASISKTQTAGILALNAEVLSATTGTHGNHSRADSSVLNLSLDIGGVIVNGDLLSAFARATCTAGAIALEGGAQLANVTVNEVSVPVNAPANFVVLDTGLVRVVANEQTTSAGGDKLTVNALHITVAGVADVIIASAHADVSACQGDPDCGRPRFVTGGGYVLGPGGGKANFAIAARDGNPADWGHLLYSDKATPFRAKGRPVGAAISDTTAEIWGTSDKGDFKVKVTDLGEPGNQDTFTITIGSYYAGGVLEGGNIQIHKPCKP